MPTIETIRHAIPSSGVGTIGRLDSTPGRARAVQGGFLNAKQILSSASLFRIQFLNPPVKADMKSKMLNSIFSYDSKCSTTMANRLHGTAFADWPSDALGRLRIGDKIRHEVNGL